MRPRTLLGAWALVLVVARVPRADGDDSNDRAAAADQFDAGRAAFARDDFLSALEHFRRAHALGGHGSVRFNIAVCLERLSRYREAIEEYEQAAASAELEDTARARARSGADRLRGRLGRIEVVRAPPGVRVWVDGKEE